jgi:hypothetical protein
MNVPADTFTTLVRARALAHVAELAAITASPVTGWEPRWRDLWAAVMGARSAGMVRAIMADDLEYGRPPHECIWC